MAMSSSSGQGIRHTTQFTQSMRTVKIRPRKACKYPNLRSFEWVSYDKVGVLYSGKLGSRSEACASDLRSYPGLWWKRINLHLYEGTKVSTLRGPAQLADLQGALCVPTFNLTCRVDGRTVEHDDERRRREDYALDQARAAAREASRAVERARQAVILSATSTPARATPSPACPLGVASQETRPGDDVFMSGSVQYMATTTRVEFSAHLAEAVIAAATAFLTSERWSSFKAEDLSVGAVWARRDNSSASDEASTYPRFGQSLKIGQRRRP